MRARAGFTLLELIVVLLILAVSSAFAVPAVQTGWKAREIRQGTRRLASVMRGLRERAIRRGEEVDLPVIRPFRDYIAWLHRQDVAAAEAFWRERLLGFAGPTPLPFDGQASASGGIEGYDVAEMRLSSELTQ